jgi:hypothetical protein
MGGFRRLPFSVGWVLSLTVSLVLASCGGSGGADSAMAAAVLWDPRAGEVVAKPETSESLDVAGFEAFIQAEPDRVAHLQMAAEMGYTTVLAAGRVIYDNGAVMTGAALSGGVEGDMAMLIIGAMPGDAETPGPPESVFIAEPVYANGELVRVDLASQRGELSLDVGTGEVELARAEYGSCATWNCLAAAVFFWWEDNSHTMDVYWDTAGEACMDCIALPHSAPVACPVCAAFLGAVVLASVTDCTIWPCDLCFSDDCHLTQYENQHCVTENGVSEVRQSVTPWVCENPKTQQAECVPGTTVTETERCPWGCRPGSPTCQYPTQCLTGLQNCSPIQQASFCLGDDLVTRYERVGCVASDDLSTPREWGSCVPTGQLYDATRICPYTCTDVSSGTAQCDPPPTCEPAVCEQFERPIGEPYCTVRPDDGKSVVVQEIEPYGCVTVQPRAAVPAAWNWPEGQACQALDPTLRAVEECPSGCAADGVSCASTNAVTLNVHLPAGADDLSTRCASCYVRLWSPDRSYPGITGGDGTVTFDDVIPGEYYPEYGCGPTTLGVHEPDEVYPDLPDRYLPAWRTWPPSAGAGTLVIPVTGLTGPVDLFLDNCP